METRTLGTFTSNRTNSQNVIDQRNDFHTFLTLFSIGIHQRFQVEDVESIDVNQIQEVARLSALCTPVVLETWNQTQNRRQRSEQRAA